MSGRIGIILGSIPLVMLLAAIISGPLVADDDGWTKFEQVKTGMSRQQVEAILGGQATGEVRQGSAWTVRGGQVVVAFDDQGRAVESSFMHGDPHGAP